MVEDDRNISDLIRMYLEKEGFDVRIAYDGGKAVEEYDRQAPDMVLLDIMLPVMDGWSVCAHIREKAKTPIIMLTAKSELDDKVMGLDCGADDYLTKPFMTKELLARLRALVRRSINTPDGALSFGDIRLEVDTSALICKEASVRLSEKEFRLLEYLIANQGRILTREQLAVKIWGYENDAEYNNVEVYLSFARKKLSFVKSKTEIKAVRGVGYELRYGDV